jgi:hypothetical protein
MKRTLFTSFLLLALMLVACDINLGGRQAVQGSGKRASETRAIGGFTAIEIDGSADVTVTFGESESVVVTTDDNLLPLIQTLLRGSQLVIRTQPDSQVSTHLGVQVRVTMKKLEAASIAGSGSITITDLQADDVIFAIPGSGTITADGIAGNVEIDLRGSGDILCSQLEARTVTVSLSGSGNVTAYASDSLDATILGSGTIRYRGSPAHVQTSVPGSGTISPLP